LKDRATLPAEVTGEFPIDATVEVQPRDFRPQETRFFSRHIRLDEFDEKGRRGYRMTVTVMPSEQSGVASWWFRRGAVEMQCLILEQPVL